MLTCIALVSQLQQEPEPESKANEGNQGGASSLAKQPAILRPDEIEKLASEDDYFYDVLFWLCKQKGIIALVATSADSVPNIIFSNFTPRFRSG
jgi:hypothetical protein